MRVATVTTMNCPRCDAPVKGDYKYCPECACRLRIHTPPAEPPPRGGRRGALLLALVAAGLVAAGIFVGYQVLGGHTVRITTPPPSQQILTVGDIPEALALVPEGVAFWEPWTVLEAPADDEVEPRLLGSFRRGQIAQFAERAARAPAHLTRWSRLVRVFYAHTRDIMVERTRRVPIRTRAFRMMRYEVSRGQYAEFLRSVERDPGQLLRQCPWLHGLWRPEERFEWAVYYRLDWWLAVEEYLRQRADDPLTEDIPVPGFVDAERLDTITDAEAIKLLYPASWVRLDEGGAPYWVLDPGTENLPVTDISWWDAQLFAVWARQQLGLGSLRVPSWYEWVRAFHGNHPAREPDADDEKGDEGWRWPWGNIVDPHGCNNLNHTWNDPVPMLRDVRRPYGWHDGDTVDGVLNMAGNAAEWTRGSFIVTLPSGESYVLPDDPTEGDTDRAFAYGGSYLSGLDDCSVKSGVSLPKTERRIDVGFRLVLDPGL